MTAATATPYQAKFLEGSIMRHVVVMTMTGAVGLMTLFIVDLVDLYFLSRLQNVNITAAIGFGGTLDFANLSLAIGAGIAAVALVSRNMGARQPERAKQFASSSLYFSLGVSAIYTALVAIFISPILAFLGATGETAHQAKLFIWTLSPGFIFLAGALSCSFSLRGIGDAKSSLAQIQRAFAHVSKKNAGQLGATPRRRSEARLAPYERTHAWGVGLVQVAFRDVRRVEVEAHDRSSSRNLPLSVSSAG